MLDLLRHIVEEVNSASDLEEALGIIVSRVKQAVSADVCSVYLTDLERRRHVLAATDGLRADAVGKVSLPLHRGLIGFVCERAEPVNIEDAPSHPRYLYIIETGEQPFHAFLGVPIIQNRKVLGVLVVRQRARRKFEENEVTFLFTLAAQLAGAITNARATGELQLLGHPDDTATSFLQGRAGSNGVSLGEAVVVYPMADLESIPDRVPENTALEEDSFRTAVQAVRDDLKKLEARMVDTLPAEERALFHALILMLESDSLIVATARRIQEGNWAAGALRHTIEEHARVFDQMEDVYLRERASDIRDLGRRILTYIQQDTPRIAEFPERTILVGDEVSAVHLAEVPPNRLAGLISSRGSSSSHVAILARAMGVPAVMGVESLPIGRLNGRRVILDGYRGRVYVSPTPSVWDEYSRLAEDERELSAELDALRTQPSETADGVRMPLYLNTGLISEMDMLGVSEAAGVGLYRTELPFMVRDRFPAESVQVSNYQRVLSTFAPRPVTLRTLDIGGDKPLPYFPLSEQNPFLGWRGIRMTLDHPEIFLTQLRAMLKASIGYRNLRILLPMISQVGEVDETLDLIHRAYDELLDEGLDVTMPPVGVMIEVPGAVYQVQDLARRVSFLSVGTNDLTQYLLAVDRNNARVADLFDELHPAVLRALVQIVDGAKANNTEVGVCGELAGNPLATPLLLGMGMDSLSMSASSLLRVKAVVRNVTLPYCKELLRRALRKEDGLAIRKMMMDALEEMNLGGLVRPGK